MVMVGHSASVALLLCFAFAVTEAIRLLKEGPMIDAEGREYKSASVRVDAEKFGGAPPNGRPPIRVQCTESSMIIVVEASKIKNGRLVSPEEVFLGEGEHSQRSQCRAVAAGDDEYVIEAELQDCGSKLTISENFVIYSNWLVISPANRHHGITRTSRVVVPVSCHFQRTHLVSSSAQQPPLTLSASATQRSAFSLKLVNDDWTRETSSRVFYLGDLLHLEASYTGPDSGQRRLFIDSCVASLSPDTTSAPRYYLIENHGCLTDAKDGGSNSLFQPRRRPSSLQLQLNAFLFHQDSRNSIFITCQLRATSEMWKSSPINKACNYVHSSWKNVDGTDHVCRCCDSTCHQSSPKWSNNSHLRRLIPEDNTICGSVTLGPLMIFPSK